MREQEPQKASDRPTAESHSASGPASDAAGAQEYLTVAANRQSLRRSTMILAVLVGIGLICLWLMIRRSQPSAAFAAPAGDQTKIEAAISRLTGVRSEMADRMDAIVKKFYEFSDVVQVRVNELVKNPFEVEGFAKDLKSGVVADDPRAEAELIRRQKIEQQAKTLKLLSIMQSNEGNCCWINDHLLRKGDMIEGFKILQISSDFVELAWPSSGVAEAGVSPTEEMKTVLKLSN